MDAAPELAQEKTTKRKRESRAAGVTASASATSIAQPPVKRSRPITTDENIPLVKPDYLKTSDQVFKQMLATALQGTESTVELLNTPETLQYARTFAQLVNDLFYLRLKQDYWDHYYRVATTTGLWSVKMARSLLTQNNLHRTQFMTETNVQGRRQKVVEQLRQAEENLNKHKQSTTNLVLSVDRLAMVIPAFVRRGQHKLVADFQHRKRLFELDANDCRLVQAFYDLQPSEEQV